MLMLDIKAWNVVSIRRDVRFTSPCISFSAARNFASSLAKAVTVLVLSVVAVATLPLPLPGVLVILRCLVLSVFASRPSNML